MIQIAQIGVGYWGPNLLRNLAANKAVRVKIVVDLAKDRRDYVGNLYPDVRVSDDIREIENDRDITAVVISTPVKTHCDLALRMLRAGKHVLIEKPMASTMAEIDAIEEASKAQKCLAMVGHTFLYNSSVRYLKNVIQQGGLGEIRYIYSQRLNLGRIRSDVDALWNFAPHDISIIQYWLNDPEPLTVAANGMDYVQEGISDVVFLTIQYPGKVLANIHMSWLDPQKVRKIVVVGSNKMAVYDDVADNKIAILDKGIDRMAILGKHMDYDHTSSLKFDYRSGDILFPNVKSEEPLKTEIAHFVDCITRGTPCLTGIEHARKVTKILSLCRPLERHP